jgi:two-component system chemotaxis response regulator CheV
MNAMMVAEFNGSTQGFLVSEVDRIIGVDWSDIRSPKGVIPGDCNLVTGVTELPGGQIVTILDVEAIQGLALGEAEIPHLAPVSSEGRKKFALVVDDSALARKKIAEVLSSMQVDYQMAVSGRDALEQLNTFADKAEHAGHQLTDYIDIIMTDAEMPEMDGFSFTKSIKGNPRFRDIPVIMHTSLSSESNRNLGRAVGVDTYVAKFDPEALAGAVRPYLEAAHA